LIKRIRWTPQLVNAFWDGVAQTELDKLSFGRVAGPQFLDLVSAYLVPGRSCLDFGAGSGHMLQLLLDRGLHAAGFEPSPDRQELLLARIGHHPNFLGVKGRDCGEQFDIVLLMEVVEHILDEDFSDALGRIAGFVRPGGYLIASTPNSENLDTSSVYCPVSDTLFHPWQHIRSFTPAQLADLFRAKGFSAELVALADFSADAEMIETCKKAIDSCKKMNAIAVLRDSSMRRLSESIESSIEAYRGRIGELESIESGFQGGTKLGIWQRIVRRVHLLIRHRELIAGLHSAARDMAHRFDEMSGYTVEQLQQIMAIAPVDAGSSAPGSDGINLRFGKESTIVYVGKKGSAAGFDKAAIRVQP